MSAPFATPTLTNPQVNMAPLTAAVLGTSAEQKQLVCKDLLEGDTLKQAKLVARKDYDVMLNNSLVYAEYGNQALEGVNALIDALLAKVRLKESPEVDRLVRTLVKNLDGIRRKYDVSDPKVLKRYQSGKATVFGFFKSADAFWRMIMNDIKSTETHVADVGRRLVDNMEITRENIVMYDQLYKENELEIAKLIFTIALMELIVDEGIADINAIPIGDSGLGDRGGEQRAKRADLVNNLQARIAEFKGRLMMAWSTAPQVRTIQALEVSQLGKTNSLFNIGVPSMKGFMVQMVILQRSKDIMETNEAVSAAINAMVQQYSSSVGLTLPLIAKSVNTPTLAVESVHALVNGYIAATDGIATAIKAGAEERAKLDHAIVSGKEAMENASTKLTDAIVAQATSAAKPLQITTTVLPAA